MKIQVLDKNGEKTREIESNIFDNNIREDIVAKIIEAEKIGQEYAPFFRAGLQTSAHGNVRHLRHMWKSDRGRGMSRIPKKKMSRSGDRFSWIGAVIPGTRGGRRAHPPKLGKRLAKVNRKEMILGLKSALAMISNINLLKEKYNRLKESEIKTKLPIVIDSKSIEFKTKDFFKLIKKILGDASIVAIQEKRIRSGKGKMRGRKYKKSSGMLLVVGKQEDKKINGIDVRTSEDLSVSDLASNGARLTMFTEIAVRELGEKLK